MPKRIKSPNGLNRTNWQGFKQRFKYCKPTGYGALTAKGKNKNSRGVPMSLLKEQEKQFRLLQFQYKKSQKGA